MPLHLSVLQFYSSLLAAFGRVSALWQPVLCLDVSVVQHPVLPLDVFLLLQSVLFLHVSVCLFCSRLSYSSLVLVCQQVYGLQQLVLHMDSLS
jgi:hypothetical protein